MKTLNTYARIVITDFYFINLQSKHNSFDFLPIKVCVCVSSICIDCPWHVSTSWLNSTSKFEWMDMIQKHTVCTRSHSWQSTPEAKPKAVRLNEMLMGLGDKIVSSHRSKDQHKRMYWYIKCSLQCSHIHNSYMEEVSNALEHVEKLKWAGAHSTVPLFQCTVCTIST